MYRPRILVIDDDPVFGQLLTGKALQRAMNVEYFPTLIDAVYASDLREFDAAVIDCMMPEISGLEVTEYLKIFHRELPVVLVSRTRDQNFADRGSDKGARAYVAKRKGLDVILDTVQKFT